jgi:hypothetical protein
LRGCIRELWKSSFDLRWFFDKLFMKLKNKEEDLVVGGKN